MAEYRPGTGPGYVGSFSLEIRNFITRTNMRVETVIKRVCMDIFRDLILVTPRDTGYARSCWAASQSSPPDVNLARGGPGPYSPREAEGIAAIQAIPFTVPGFVCYIYNNCRYIIPLEYGHSSQAPRGMAAVTLTRFQNYVAKAAAGR